MSAEPRKKPPRFRRNAAAIIMQLVSLLLSDNQNQRKKIEKRMKKYVTNSRRQLGLVVSTKLTGKRELHTDPGLLRDKKTSHDGNIVKVCIEGRSRSFPHRSKRKVYSESS